jgi:hypothetical protein
MGDQFDTASRVAEYLALSEKMRVAADRAFDPLIVSAYLALSAKWVRLAEQAQRDAFRTDRGAAESSDSASPL